MTEPQQATWAVQSQQQRTQVNTAGQVQDGYQVTFLTGGGHTGSVFVPMAKYTVDNVRQAVQAQANLLDAVGGLTSQD